MTPDRRITRIIALATETLQTHGLAQQGWKFVIDRRPLIRVGECRYDEREVALSEWFVLSNPRHVVDDAMLHEVAHAMTHPSVGHGLAWRLACCVLGCRSQAFNTPDTPGFVFPPFKYAATCPSCELVYGRFSISQYSRRPASCPCGSTLKFTRTQPGREHRWYKEASSA